MTTDESLIDGAKPVREGEELDAAALAAYLQERVPGLEGELAIEQFRKGHSNLTYLLRLGDRELVLRRPPFGAKIATAHDMGREYRILAALQGIYDAAPPPLVHCEDEGVIGAPFYVMERMRGVILRGNAAPPGIELGEARMRALSTMLVDSLAALHAVDIEATGLVALGKPEGYVERQVSGWTKRYYKAKTDEIPEVEQAAAWLGEHRPPERGASLIHGDFKYDNFVLDPADLSRILAVLDWEMATVGDPLMDLGTSLGYWIEAGDSDEARMVPIVPTTLPGNLTRQQIVDRYEETSGREVPDRVFYYVYGLFKVAVIAQQIYKRFVEGHTKDPRFAMMIMGVKILGNQAARALDRGRIHDLG